ncbi:MAG: acyltransferase family protein, partial [Gemmatimonadales bacterium]
MNLVASATGSRDASAAGADRTRLDWLDALKALAILGILLNHLVEQFGPGPWFTRMGDWFGAGTRWEALWPAGPFPVDLIRFLGWLGDGAPGVFLLVSGVGLALAAARRDTFDTTDFYRRRLRRLFPLYIACHFAILGAAALLPGALPGFGDPRTLFSLTGVRSTDATFFWISPSWWFVWTILQLYLAFPLLWWSLCRHGTPRFLAGCLFLTFVARGLGLTVAPNLYFWMTGIFAGTRLAEFAVGMAIGVALARDPEALRAWSRRAIPAGLILWTAGVAAAFTPAGAIVSYLLVTIGMSATGYGVWQVLRRWVVS